MGRGGGGVGEENELESGMRAREAGLVEGGSERGGDGWLVGPVCRSASQVLCMVRVCVSVNVSSLGGRERESE